MEWVKVSSTVHVPSSTLFSLAIHCFCSFWWVPGCLGRDACVCVCVCDSFLFFSWISSSWIINQFMLYCCKHWLRGPSGISPVHQPTTPTQMRILIEPNHLVVQFIRGSSNYLSFDSSSAPRSACLQQPQNLFKSFYNTIYCELKLPMLLNELFIIRNSSELDRKIYVY